MCGRMTLTRSAEEIADYFVLAMAQERGECVAEIDGSPLRARYNVAPSQPVATIVADGEGVRELAWKHWGLVPSWAGDPVIGGRLFNARSETVDRKPSFREAFQKRRCLVVADGFYEWAPRNRGHQPYYFTPVRGALLGFGGLFEVWRGEGGEVIESCTVLTSEANADVAGVHHRMPVILDPADFGRWLSRTADPDRTKSLAVPAPPGTLLRRAVGRVVNSPQTDDARCLEAVAEVEPSQGELFACAGSETE